MIKVTANVSTSIIDALDNRLESINALVADIGRDVANDYTPLLERELATNVPPKRSFPSDYPIEWVSDAQRRAFFAKTKGKPYVRTGQLANSWTVDVTTEGGIFSINVRNPANAAKYVYGSLSRQSPGRFQQRFHKITGWPVAAEIIRPVLQEMIDEFADKFRDAIGDFGNVTGSGIRAYTSPRKRG